MKKKILFILHVPPPVHGAAMVGKFIKESNLINSEFDCTYINLGTSTDLNQIGKSGFKKIGGLLSIQIQVLKAMIKLKPDLCYMTLTANGPGFYKDVMVVRILKLFNTSIIYHFHNKGFAQSISNALNKYLHRFALRNTKSILLSKHLFPDISYYVKKEHIYICPNGIPPVPKSPVKKSKDYTLSFRILYLSNMMVGKGVWVLLEACKILKSKGVQFQCDFVGDWFDISQEDFQNYLDQHGLNDEVKAYGKKYGAEKIGFFENANVFVFPTFYKNECFPLVLLEAMDYSLPVISTPEGGIKDIIQDNENGFIVLQKDAGAIADKLELLASQPLLCEQFGNASNDRFTSLFTLEEFEKNLCGILREECDNS